MKINNGKKLLLSAAVAALILGCVTVDSDPVAEWQRSRSMALAINAAKEQGRWPESGDVTYHSKLAGKFSSLGDPFNDVAPQIASVYIDVVNGLDRQYGRNKGLRLHEQYSKLTQLDIPPKTESEVFALWDALDAEDKENGCGGQLQSRIDAWKSYIKYVKEESTAATQLQKCDQCLNNEIPILIQAVEIAYRDGCNNVQGLNLEGFESVSVVHALGCDEDALLKQLEDARKGAVLLKDLLMREKRIQERLCGNAGDMSPVGVMDARQQVNQDETRAVVKESTPSLKNDSDGVVSVLGKGVGVTRIDARKDAFRDAIEKAVGLYVDAEQLVKNNEVIKDQILTHSNAYIERYELLNEVKGEGTESIRIRALIRQKDMAQRLKEILPVGTVNVPEATQNLHARISTVVKRSEDAKKLLERVFADLNPIAQLMRLDILDFEHPKIKAADVQNDSVRLTYPIRLTVDETAYAAWAQKMDELLSQISVMGKKIVATGFDRRFRLPVHEGDVFNRLNTIQGNSMFCYGNNFFRFQLDNGCVKSVLRQIRGTNVEGLREFSNLGSPVLIWSNTDFPILEHNLKRQLDNDYRVSRYGVLNNVAQHLNCEEDRQIYVLLLNRKGASFANLYALDDLVATLPVRWLPNFSGNPDRWGGNSSANRTSFNVLFKGENGDVIAAGNIQVINPDVVNVGFFRPMNYLATVHACQAGLKIPYVFYVSPYVGCCADAGMTSVSVELPRDDVARIKSYSIELAE